MRASNAAAERAGQGVATVKTAIVTCSRKDGVTYLRHSQMCKDYVAGMLSQVTGGGGFDVTPALRDDDNASTERGGRKGRARGHLAGGNFSPNPDPAADFRRADPRIAPSRRGRLPPWLGALEP